jgi:beta-lactamase class A
VKSILVAGIALAIAANGVASAGECRAPTPLRHKDPLLQTQLARELRAAGLERALGRRELAVSIVDLTIPGELAYAGLNDDHMMYAASLPKIGILLATLEEVNAGRLAWTADFSWRLTKMITISNNEYATWAARLVGLREIAEVLRAPRYCLYEEGVGGLWMGRTFEKEALVYRDPLRQISHGATTRQTARFYVLLDAGQLVSPYWSEWMLAHMAPPEYVHKFFKALRDRPGISFVARKSGTWQDFHSDSALVEHDGRRYVIVALAAHRSGETMMKQIAEIADEMIERGEHRRWPALLPHRESSTEERP